MSTESTLAMLGGATSNWKMFPLSIARETSHPEDGGGGRWMGNQGAGVSGRLGGIQLLLGKGGGIPEAEVVGVKGGGNGQSIPGVGG